MSDRDKVLVEYEVENETLLRAVQIDQAKPEVWDFFEDILDMLELVEAHGGIPRQDISNHDPRLENMVDREEKSFFEMLAEGYDLIEYDEQREYIDSIRGG